MKKISKLGFRDHSKASERYIDVVFDFDDGTKLDTSIPTHYRRTGTEFADADVDAYISEVYDEVHPNKWQSWRGEQKNFWLTKPKASVTKNFFDVLSKKFTWCCATCQLPANPNWARRIQDLKEFGYTIATNTSKLCTQCKKNTTQLILLPISRGGITGYETWTPALRARIIQELRAFDAYEAKIVRKEGLLPDHKFPEIRWDKSTRRESLEHLSADDIKRDFQLLSNQRNQQKREVCRSCFQTGDRGIIYGIPFYYDGTPKWDKKIPKTGKNAEQGCIGCGWYDINTWRIKLLNVIYK